MRDDLTQHTIQIVAHCTAPVFLLRDPAMLGEHLCLIHFHGRHTWESRGWDIILRVHDSLTFTVMGE
jgi:hypothetical protein